MSEPTTAAAERDVPRVQEGVECSHGVQGPYASAGEPVANCGERGTVVYRLAYPDGRVSQRGATPPAEASPMSERARPLVGNDELAARIKAVLDDHNVMVTFDEDPPIAITICSCGFKDTLMSTEPNEHLAEQVAACIFRPGMTGGPDV